MIKANELRIGNWFRHNNTFCKEEMHFEYELIKLGELVRDEFPQFDPVPLTPEILEKAGFAKQDNLSYQLDAEFAVRFWSKKGNEVNLYYESDEMGQSIYFLHQLQNLYFALTGTELTIAL